MTRIAFVCVGNAGRSQIATAFAELERKRRDLDDSLELITGGIDPSDRIHETVIESLLEKGIDIEGRKPRRITPSDVADAEYVVTMGCAANEFTPKDWDGKAERWDLDHPDNNDLEDIRIQRDEIEGRVADFFDRIKDDFE